MDTTEQARSTIWSAISAWTGQGTGPQGPYAFARAADVSASMLYQFARPKKGKLASKRVYLGNDTVNKLAKMLPEIDHATWLAAMGVAPDAPAKPSTRGEANP